MCESWARYRASSYIWNRPLLIPVRAVHRALYASRQAQEVDVRLLTIIRQLRLTHAFPDTDTEAAGVTVVRDTPTPAPSEEIRRLQLAMLERHVMATRLHRGARWNS